MFLIALGSEIIRPQTTTRLSQAQSKANLQFLKEKSNKSCQFQYNRDSNNNQLLPNRLLSLNPYRRPKFKAEELPLRVLTAGLQFPGIRRAQGRPLRASNILGLTPQKWGSRWTNNSIWVCTICHPRAILWADTSPNSLALMISLTRW